MTLWRLRHRPHMHRDCPVRLDHRLVHLREDDFAVRSDQVVVAFVDVLADYINMKESLVDKCFHALYLVVSLCCLQK
jgi:hypothetical protein